MTRPVHTLRRACVFLGALLSSLNGAAKDDEPSTAWIEFRVKVPASTKGTEDVYLSGSLEALGTWKPDGLRLDRSKDGTHGARVKLPLGKKLEFKVTRGSWRTVERALDGSDIPNRELRVERDALVELEVASWEGKAPAAKRSTVTGIVREHSRFPSRHLGNERTVLVWLPPGYEKDAAARYPVLYLHDGQNVFDAATAFAGKEWRADEAADRLIREGRIRPLILVAIHNTPDRIAEYAPWRDAKLGGGKGNIHARFLVEELKPFIDREYRTLAGKEHTGVAGSSLGGLISLHVAMRHPDVFSRCAALSPSLWWDDRRVLADLEAGAAARLRGLKLWLDMGTREGGQEEDGAGERTAAAGPIADARKLAGILDAAGWTAGKDYHYLEAAGARHDEQAWAERFPRVLTFLFGATPGRE